MFSQKKYWTVVNNIICDSSKSITSDSHFLPEKELYALRKVDVKWNYPEYSQILFIIMRL